MERVDYAWCSLQSRRCAHSSNSPTTEVRAVELWPPASRELLSDLLSNTCPELLSALFVLWSLNNLLYLFMTTGVFWDNGSNLAHVETMTIGQYTEGATKSENIFGHSWFRRFFHCLEFAAELLVILLERKPYGPSNLWNFFLAYCYEASLWFFF